jgi:ABC-type transport system substrate-binding protein
MRRSRTLVVVSAIVALVVTACGGGTTSGPDAATGEVDRGGTLRMAWTVPPTNLDPHLSIDPRIGFPYLSPVYDRLTRVTNGAGEAATAEVGPMLATAWEFSADGRTLTMHLRTDATFHDGTKVDGEAVKVSLERGKTMQGSTAATVLAPIETITAPDPATVVLALNRPAADVLFTLSTTAASIISPAALSSGIDLGTQEAGSGPYRLGELRTGDRVTYTRADGYWEPEAQQAETIELIGMVDDKARINALRSGQVDAVLIKIGQHDEAEQLAKDGKFSVVDTGPLSWYATFLNTARPALDDVRVRRALNYAIDRDAINDTVLDGQCPGTSQPLQAGEPGTAPGADGAYRYDPAEARRLLAEAGHPDGFTLQMVVIAGLSPQIELAPIVQAQLGEVGVQVEITAVDTVAASRIWNGGQSDIYLHVHSSTAEPAVTLQSAYQSAAFPGPAPDGFAELMQRGVDSTLDQDARYAELAKASAFASENAMDLFMCALPTQYAASSSVVGLDRNASPFGGIFDLRYVGVRAKS